MSYTRLDEAHFNALTPIRGLYPVRAVKVGTNYVKSINVVSIDGVDLVEVRIKHPDSQGDAVTLIPCVSVQSIYPAVERTAAQRALGKSK